MCIEHKSQIIGNSSKCEKDVYLKDMWYESVVMLMLIFVELLQVGQVLIFTVLGYLMSQLSLLFCLERQKARETNRKT